MSSARPAELTEALRRVWLASLAEFDLAGLVRAACERKLAPAAARASSPRRACAVGKAAAAMLAGALDSGRRYHEVVMVVPEDNADVRRVIERARADAPGGATLLIGAHPVPDGRSEHAGRTLLAFAERAGAEGTPLDVFVSGGASSLACVPTAGLDLDTKAGLHAALLASGADIRAINLVRRHVSALKGGGVLRAAAPAAVDTFVVSDVLGGEAFDVGSGPSVPDPTTVDQARRALQKFAPAFAHVPLVETVKASEIPTARRSITMVADATSFAAFVGARLEAEGHAVRMAPSDLGTPIDKLAASLVAAAGTLAPGEVFIQPVEPSVIVPVDAQGRGGRATHLAALVAGSLPSDVVFFAGATDGVDGGSNTGGAVVTRESADRLGEALKTAVQLLDASRALTSIGATLPGRESGLNFADLVVMVRAAG